jgi:hypothetical protein
MKDKRKGKRGGKKNKDLAVKLAEEASVDNILEDSVLSAEKEAVKTKEVKIPMAQKEARQLPHLTFDTISYFSTLELKLDDPEALEGLNMMSVSDSSLYTLDEDGGDGREDSGLSQIEHTFIQPWQWRQTVKPVEEEEFRNRADRVQTVYDMPAIIERYIPHTSAKEYLLLGSVDEGNDMQGQFEILVKDLGEVFAARIGIVQEINKEHFS